MRRSERVEKDRSIRGRQEQRLLADLDKLAQRIAKGHLGRELKIGEAIGRLKERYPRYYWTHYDAKAGRLCHEVDSERRARPIFHHLERRVETHIFLCVLAYHLLVAIETTLRGDGEHAS